MCKKKHIMKNLQTFNEFINEAYADEVIPKEIKLSTSEKAIKDTLQKQTKYEWIAAEKNKNEIKFVTPSINGTIDAGFSLVVDVNKSICSFYVNDDYVEIGAHSVNKVNTKLVDKALKYAIDNDMYESAVNELSGLANKADKFIFLCQLIVDKAKINKDEVIEELKVSGILGSYAAISELTKKMIL